MANVTETETWEAGVYRIETTDPVQGGEAGIANKGIKNLANRTGWLRRQDINKRGAGALAKQCIVTCKHTGLTVDLIGGSPFTAGTNLTIYASTNDPLVMTFSGGYDENGPIVKYAVFTMNQVIPIVSSSDKLIVATIDNSDVCTITLEDYYAPVYSYAEPSSPANGWYWYDLRHEVMYKRVAGAWTKVYAVVIGYVSPGDGLADVYPKVGKSAIATYGDGPIPAGTVTAYAGNSGGFSKLPPGYLKCNGAAVSRTTYANLFDAIGTQFGAGNGSTTFNVPDLRGEFIRGFDDGRGVDSGRVFGSAQADDFKSHRHGILTTTVGAGSSAVAALGGGSGNVTDYTGGTETRPRNIAMSYIIKY